MSLINKNKKIIKRTKKVECHECQRNAIKYPKLFFIHWFYRDLYTCIDCIEAAYLQIKLDIVNDKRNK